MRPTERIKAYNQRIRAALRKRFPAANLEKGLEFGQDSDMRIKIKTSFEGDLVINVKNLKEKRATGEEQDPASLRSGVHSIESTFHYGASGSGTGFMVYFEVKQDPNLPQCKYRTDTIGRTRSVDDHPEFANQLYRAAENLLTILAGEERRPIADNESPMLNQQTQDRSLVPRSD